MIKERLKVLREDILNKRGQIVFDFNYAFATDLISNTRGYIEEYGYSNVITFIDEELEMLNDELSTDSDTRRVIDTLWYDTINFLETDYYFMIGKIKYFGDDISESFKEALLNTISETDLVNGFAEDQFQIKAYELLPKNVIIKKILRKL